MAHLQIVPKVIPIRNREMTQQRLISSVGKVIAEVGFRKLGVNMVAKEAGVDKKLIYRYFHGLDGLVAAYGQTEEFWPSSQELIGQDREYLSSLAPDGIITEFFKRYLRAILRRPNTLEVLAWEAVERNPLTVGLEEVRVKCALEFFELMNADPNEEVDLTALILILAGAVNFLAVRSRIHSSLGGVDLASEAGWKRIEVTLEHMIKSALQ